MLQEMQNEGKGIVNLNFMPKRFLHECRKTYKQEEWEKWTRALQNIQNMLR